MTAIINVFRVYEVKFRSGLMRAEVGDTFHPVLTDSLHPPASHEGHEHVGPQPHRVGGGTSFQSRPFTLIDPPSDSGGSQ